MRQYLATLHQKPDHHKKRFALLVSGSFTLLIFGIWFLVRTGGESVVAENSKEVTPLGSFQASIGAALKVLRNDVGDRETGLETVQKYGR